MKTGNLAVSAALLMLLAGCIDVGLRLEVDEFLRSYESEYQRLSYEWSEADWASNTHIVEGDSMNAVRTRAAHEAYPGFVGSTENIDAIRGYVAQRDQLTPLQVRQLERMLYNAAQEPQTVPDVVRDRVAAEAEQNERLYGFEYHMGGRAVTPNEIDAILRTSRDLVQRRRAWEASKEVGAALKNGIVRLRDLRNRTVQALGYPDFWSYQVSDYGMTADEMLALSDRLIEELRPLYRELHTWARYELARRFGEPVPDFVPAHWLPQPLGAGLERPGDCGGHRCRRRAGRAHGRMGGETGGSLLRQPRLRQAAPIVLGEVVPLSPRSRRAI